MTSTLSTPTKTIPAETTVDLLIIGAGTGMFTALAAHKQGLSTLVVEKTKFVGGSMALSGGGIWIPANHVLRRSGVLDTIERAAQYLTSILGKDTDEPSWRNFLEHGPDTMKLLEDATPLKLSWSRGYADYHDAPGTSASGRACESRPFNAAILGAERDAVRPTAMAPPVPMPVTGADYRWMNLMVTVPTKGIPRVARRVAQGIGGKLIKREYVAGGAALAAGIYAGVLKAGIPVWRETSLVRLITEDTKVTGAVLEHDGEEFAVTARRGVVLAAGGFDHNMALRHEHQSETLGEWSQGSPGNTGDAIQVAANDVGAGTAWLDQAWWFPCVAPLAGEKPKVMLAERSLPGSLIVDETGQRFIKESIDYMTFGQEVLAREQAGTSVGQMWIIFDQANRNSYVFAGELFPRMPIPSEWYSQKIAFRAKTITELATLTGLDRLPETMKRFNLLASAGADDDFGRGTTAYDRYYGDPSQTPNPNLRPLQKGPFYAVKMVLSDLGTCGGIMTDRNARALRQDGSVIDGLYATGNTAANVFGDVYPGAGATIGQGLVFGNIAARHAAGRV